MIGIVLWAILILLSLLVLVRLLDCTVGHIRIIFGFLVLNKMAVLADFENSEKVRDVSF